MQSIKIKKKILFMVINMNIGGTEKALLNMLNEIPKEQYDITLLMLEEYGGFLDDIPKHVNVKYVEDYQRIKKSLMEPPYLVAKEFICSGELSKGINHFFYHTLSKVFKDRSFYFSYLLKKSARDTTEYDIAVAYAGPMDFISYYIAKNILAKRKIQWIHFDIEKIGFNVSFSKRIYKLFNNIFIVSEEAKQKILKKIPSISEKTKVFHNIVSPEIIKKQSNIGSGFKDFEKGIKILTVGRLSKEKGYDMAINVLEKLVRSCYGVTWYWIGDGKERKNLEQKVKKLGLEKNFILLGSKKNPYRYIKEADIYVQPSYYEGYCISVMEAKALAKPIVSTLVNGVSEQIKNEKTGLIVDIDESSIYEGIVKIIDNNLFDKFNKNLEEELIYSKGKGIKHINNLFDI